MWHIYESESILGMSQIDEVFFRIWGKWYSVNEHIFGGVDDLELLVLVTYWHTKFHTAFLSYSLVSLDDGWVISIKRLQKPSHGVVRALLFEVLVEWQCIFRLFEPRHFVGEAPGFETFTVWSHDADLKEVMINLLLFIQVFIAPLAATVITMDINFGEVNLDADLIISSKIYTNRRSMIRKVDVHVKLEANTVPWIGQPLFFISFIMLKMTLPLPPYQPSIAAWP